MCVYKNVRSGVESETVAFANRHRFVQVSHVVEVERRRDVGLFQQQRLFHGRMMRWLVMLRMLILMLLDAESSQRGRVGVLRRVATVAICTGSGSKKIGHGKRLWLRLRW